ncbi:unnamed protein product, partial [Coregonus sp. 'balchen']
GKEFCFGVNNEQYRCEMGYCCGETECCTYYYELWCMFIMRLQQEQRQREISLMAYQGASSSFISPPPLNLRFWTDCKLPDYEEVVGHPPTPPPPYSEIPPGTTPAILLPPIQSEAAVVLEPPIEDIPREEQASSSSADQESASAPSQSERPLEEELMTRRRHVTGDSGIEVCVCQLDEGSGPEEDEERVCQGARGDCCSASEHHHNIRHKERTPEPQPKGQTTSTGDRL